VKILALELSTARGSLAWLDEDGIDFAREWPNDRKDSAVFFENLHGVKAKFGAPDTIIVGLGPGSYAGTRIAISTAIGLQISSRAALIGLPSISAMECDEPEYCAIGDARRKSFFFARIGANNVVEGPMLLSEPELTAKLDTIPVATPVFTSDLLPQFGRAIVRYPSSLVLARLARDPQRSFSLPPLEPIYLREPHITMPTRGIGILADKQPSG
jgi:tRNA threonylcarbamoyl adenosine modification protein YeaZ